MPRALPGFVVCNYINAIGRWSWPARNLRNYRSAERACRADVVSHVRDLIDEVEKILGQGHSRQRDVDEIVGTDFEVVGHEQTFWIAIVQAVNNRDAFWCGPDLDSQSRGNGWPLEAENHNGLRVGLILAQSSGAGDRRRRARAAAEIEAIALAELRSRIGDLHGTDALDTLAAEVVAGTRDPYTAADELVASLTG